jgi:hypothetical protein
MFCSVTLIMTSIVQSNNFYELLRDGFSVTSVSSANGGNDHIILPSFAGIVTGGEMHDVIDIQSTDFVIACGDACDGNSINHSFFASLPFPF